MSLLNPSPDRYDWFPRSTTTIPATEYVHDYVIAGAVLFPIVIFLLVANVLMFSAVLDMVISRNREDACGGPLLILNLAVADIMLGIASLINLSDSVDPSRPLDNCFVAIGFIAMATMATCLIMAAIAFERYKTIRTPFRRRRNDTRKVIVAIFFIWVSSALVGFAPFMGWRAENPYNEDGRCVFLSAVPESYILFVVFGIYLPTLSATSYLHITMCQASRKQNRKIVACEVMSRRARGTCEQSNNRPRLRTEMTDIPTPVSSELPDNVNSNEQIFSVTTNMATEELPMANPAYGPIELPMTECSMSSVEESTANRNESNSSNIPSIWNTIRPEKWSRTVILILGFFISMWSPFWIVCVMQAVCVDGTCDYEDLASTYLLVLGVSNSAVNPVVYISTDRKLKEHFCRCFFRSTDDPDREDSSSSVFATSQTSNDP